MKAKNIEHTVRLNATPGKVYTALMNQKQHAQFTGEAAKIRVKAGGSFTCHGDYIRGVNLELEPNARIIQAWRARNRPAGPYSVVTFALRGKPGGRTELQFTQIGVPARTTPARTKAGRRTIGSR